MRTIDPALPRIGADLMTLRVVMRIVHQRKNIFRQTLNQV